MTLEAFDLWEDEKNTEQKTVKDIQFLQPKEVMLDIDENTINIYSPSNLLQIPGMKELQNFEYEKVPNGLKITCLLNKPNAFMVFFLLKGLTFKESDAALEIIKEYARKVPKPFAKVADTGKTIEVQVPLARPYKSLMEKLDGRPMGSGVYRLSFARSLDLELLALSMEQRLPKIKLDDEIYSINHEPLPNFDGTIESLKNVPINELNVVKLNMQSWKEKKKSNKTLSEKFNDFGIFTLYDLLYNTPRRFIDKSKPQEITDLVEGESATIVGNVIASGEISNNMGAWFMIATDPTHAIRVSFFRQPWLLSKFSVGREVLVTGKVNSWKGKMQLGGTTIEHSDEASLLPIVPVYKQSETKGITTRLLLHAIREVFARLNNAKFKLPTFIKEENRELSFSDSIRNLHLPDSLEDHRKAIDTLAFHELLDMQILMKYFASRESGMTGISQKPSPQKLQKRMINALPFTMTNSQVKALETLNEYMASDEPSSTLLSAEVGSGKTLVSQLAAIRSVESKGQAAIIAPTEILANQLYESFAKATECLGDYCHVAKLTGSTKTRERKKILEGLEDGTVDIVVGTGSLFSDSVVYKDLRFVCFDEQQKFGAEQRSIILESRKDGRAPDMLMQTATPIPRSTAQMFYGGLNILTLDEKPPGRLPITTQWIDMNPTDFMNQLVNPVWDDIISEAQKGHQTFIVTPLVMDSDKVDASSVKSTYEKLSEGPLSELKLDFVHGQMSSKTARENMEKFKKGEFDVLVGSTSVEVGVDIPNATRVVVLSADRFGASSLHQIRGRVGRNSIPSECTLVAKASNDNAQKRLQALVDSENGFDIAKVDLEVRGEGTMFSREQSGDSTMKFASILTHAHLVEEASKDADRILNSAYAKNAVRRAMEKNDKNERLM